MSILSGVPKGCRWVGNTDIITPARALGSPCVGGRGGGEGKGMLLASLQDHRDLYHPLPTSNHWMSEPQGGPKEGRRGK